MTARVTAVVLSWNGAEDTLACLQSLAAATYARCLVVVVDNDSPTARSRRSGGVPARCM